MVKINGKNCDVSGVTLAEYLKNENYDLKRVAVEQNGKIVPKSLYDQTFLKEGDSIEIVRFVGGG